MGFLLFGTEQSDNLAGGDGDDQIFGQGGNDTLSGNAGADTLDGGLGNDQLRGGQGNDLLLGNEGNDNLDGEAGDDTLDGGAGTDIYKFGRGDGHDVITGFQLSQDLILFDSGILLSDVRVTRENDDLLLTIKDGGDSVRVSGWFSFAGNQLLRINFADGTSWTPAAIDLKVASSNDVVSGTGSSETLDGGPGDDWLFGFAGNDVLYGDVGNDTLDGGDGVDTYLFGRGDGQDLISPSTSTFAADKLQFTSGITVADVAVSQVADDLVLTIKGSTDSVRISEYFINGNWGGQIRFVDGTSWDVATILSHLTPTDNMIGGTPGNDFLDGGAGNDFLYGDAGNDTLYGGSGSDGLDGGPGADTYLFGRDDGEDWINSIAPLSEDRLQFGGSISFTDVEATVINASLSGNDLLLTLKGSADKVHVPGYFWGGASQLGEIRFADGTIWDASVINRKVFLSNDALYGTGGADLLDGGLGNDTLSGAEGDDVLYGDSGDDRMEGGLGSDRYYFGRASGHDTIVEQVQAPGDTDSVVFSRDVAVQDLVVTRDLDDLVVGVYGSAAQLRISAWFQPFVASRVERFVFGDGTVLSDQGIEAMLDNAPLVASPIADQSGRENAFFTFTVPDGTFADPDAGDVLTLSARLPGGQPLPDWLLFDAASGTFSGMPPIGTAGTLSVEVLATDRGGLGTSDQFDIAIQSSTTFLGTDGDDFLAGTGADDQMSGLGGNDYLTAGMGNDTLDGGAGNDFLAGGEGDDLYLPGAGLDWIYEGSGDDELRMPAGIAPDQVERIRPDGTNDLVLRAVGASDEVKIGNWFSDPSFQIERVVFGDGTVWDPATSGSLRRLGTEGNDVLFGSALSGGLLDGRGGDDVLIGGLGNDTLDGGTGNDFLNGSSGDDLYLAGTGQDSVIDFSGNDELRFAAGISPDQVERIRPDGTDDLVLRVAGTSDEVRIVNWFSAFAGPDNQIERVVFGDGTVWDPATSGSLRRLGTEGNDVLFGSALSGGLLDGRGGDDVLIGGLGNDTLDGGTGNDFLNGSSGDDLYLAGTGQDSVIDFSGNDELRFAAGISPDQVERIRPDGTDDLVLRVAGTSDEVRIVNWFSAFAGPDNQIERVVFGDGTVWDPATSGSLRRLGTEGNDVLFGSALSGGLLDGRGGDDVLIGGLGNDTLDGGTGNDFLNGSSGDDLYLAGTGQDSVIDFSGNDELRFAAGISPDQVERIRPDGTDDLVLRVAGTSDEVRIVNWFSAFAGPDNQIERVVFGDGTVWDPATSGSLRRLGTEGNDVLFGSALSGGLLDGRGGDDVLIGGLGNDTLDGGTGNDFLNGSSGDDLYLAGTGQDSVIDFSGNDELRFAAGISPDQVERIRPDGTDDLVLRVAGTSDEVRIVNWFSAFAGPDNQIERVVFGDGTVWDPATSSMTNRPPVANPDLVSANEDATTANLVPLLLANDTDADAGDTRSIAAVDTTGTVGTVAFDAATQTLTYSADAASQDALATGETSTDGFSYTIADSQGAMSTAAVTVTVTGVNDAPVATGETFTIGAAFPPTLRGTVLANDSDPDNGAIIRVANGGRFDLTFGTLELAGKGLYIYTADHQLAVLSLAQGQVGIDQFTYTVTDDFSNPSDALTATAQFTVNIVGVNDAPVALGDVGSVQEDAVLTASGNVLAHDYDYDQGAVLTLANPGTYAGAYGTLVLAADGNYTYTLANASSAVQGLVQGEFQWEVFGYSISDGIAVSGAQIQIGVTGANDLPVAVADSIAVDEGATSANLAPTLLANDTDADNGDQRRITAVDTTGTVGTVSFNAATQTLSYSADAASQGALETGQTAIDRFSYTIVDLFGGTSTATVFVTVNGISDTPVAVADHAAASEDATTANLVPLLLANDSAPVSGDTLRVVAADTSGTIGSVHLDTATQTLTYSADAGSQDALSSGETASDSFGYTVADSQGATATASVTVTVTGVNDAPIVIDEDLAHPGSSSGIVLGGNVLSNDRDPDHGAILSVANPGVYTGTFGTFQVDAQGLYTYRVDNLPAEASLAQGQFGVERFAYTVTDRLSNPGDALTANGVVSVIVIGRNDAPVLGTPLADQTAGEKQLFTFQLPAGTFTDVDSGDTLSLAATLADGTALPSWLSFNAANLTFTGTPGHADIGTANVKVVATDAHGASASDIFAISTVQTVFTGTSGADNLVGSAFNDTLSGLGGNDVLDGGAGNDTLDGGAGRDTMTGGTGDDTYVVSVATDVVTENPGEGNDTVQSAVTLTLGANVENLILTGSSSISGIGNALNNLVRGNSASNTLNGADGFDALEGGAGNDALNDTSGGNYYNGGAGTDTLTGGSSGDFFMGGTGNDTISTGNGPDVIAFNVGDGQDKVNPSSGVDDTVSLGGAGLNYANLTFQKSANNLILNVSATDKITFTNWYSAAANKNVLDLQVVAEAMAGFNPAGGNALLDNKVENFNFQGLVGAFDAARAVNPTLTTWALTNALTQFQLAGSDTAALGGDLAYQYGLNGTVAGIGFDKAQDVVTGAGFGTQAQTLRPLASLQDGVTPLG